MDDDQMGLISLIALALEYPTQFGLTEGPMHPDEAEARHHQNDWLHRVLTAENPRRCKDEVGVLKPTFDALKEAMKVSLLEVVPHCRQPSECGDFLSLDEIIVSFLLVLMMGGGFRNAANRLGRSYASVHHSFWIAVHAFLKSVYREEVQFIPNLGAHPKIVNESKYHCFGQVRGAGDGIYIATIPYAIDKPRMMNRKGYASQNVFALADFDLYYLFVQPGGDGCANDAQILNHILDHRLFSLGENDRILLDAIYALRPNMLTPFRGIRYHLQEWESGQNRPQNAREIYNLRHAQLRQCIERAFGYTYGKFRILREPLMFQDVNKQNAIIYCIFGLHNFILRREGIDEGQFLAPDDFVTHDIEVEPAEDLDDEAGRRTRDVIANRLWDLYLHECQTLGLPVE